ncbi:hypothetical protein L7F22_009750 [Adiantum nelumboides]|nr:hypothetical protein [Adiantum nelumboides]
MTSIGSGKREVGVQVRDAVGGRLPRGDEVVEAAVDELADVVAEAPHPLGRERGDQQPAHPVVLGLLGLHGAGGAGQDRRLGHPGRLLGRGVRAAETRVGEQGARLGVPGDQPRRVTDRGAHRHDRPLAAEHRVQRRDVDDVRTVEGQLRGLGRRHGGTPSSS